MVATRSRTSISAEQFRADYAPSSTATSAGAACRSRRRPVRLGRRIDLRPAAAVLRRPDAEAAAGRRHRGRPCARDARRLDHYDHISPAGDHADSPAGPYSSSRRRAADFNSYGARRGNHEVMMRGTFANIRLRNELVPGSEGTGRSTSPAGEELTIFDASALPRRRHADDRDRRQGVRIGLVARLGGQGTGAARRPGVIAECFERIHRSNLVGMGVLPLQFLDGESPETLGLTGRETFSIVGVENGEATEVTVRADDQEFVRASGSTPRASASISATAGSSRTSCGASSPSRRHRPARRRARRRPPRRSATGSACRWSRRTPSRRPSPSSSGRKAETRHASLGSLSSA